MKTGILIALAAMALAVVAVPDAHAWWWHHRGPDLHMKIFGGNLISSDMGGEPTPVDGRTVTALQSARTKGSGNPDLFSTATLQAVDLENPPSGCPAALPFGNSISATLVFTYHDGSLLSLETESGSFYCSDGVNFIVEFVGTIVGGNKRFRNAAGSWEGTAMTFPGGRFTGEVSVDLD